MFRLLCSIIPELCVLVTNGLSRSSATPDQAGTMQVKSEEESTKILPPLKGGCKKNVK